MSSNRSSLVNTLISSGSAATSKRKDDKLEEAANAVGELFSDVEAGTRPLGDLDDLIDHVNGNSSNPQSGQPVGALGAGPSGSTAQIDDMSALQHLWTSTTLDPGVQNALKRLFAPNGDPTRMEVKPDGTPVVVDSLQNEVRTKETARATLETELNDERNENKSGSLAAKLKAATAAPATPAGSVDKATLKTKVEQLREDEQHLDTSFATNKIQGRDDLDATIAELEQLVS